MPGPADDPLAAVAALPGVATAAAQARDGVDALLRHPRLSQGAAAVSAASTVRGAQASAVLEGADDPPSAADPRVQGALRAGAEIVRLAAVWGRAPQQVVARLHVLVAHGLLPAERLGRPLDDPGVAQRLAALGALATAPTAAPAVVVAAVVHGELATLRPFGVGDGLVARALERVVLVARGTDPAGVTPTEAGHLRLRRAYLPLLEAYAGGTAAGVAAWVQHCCAAYAAAAEEGLAICAADGSTASAASAGTAR